MMICIHFYLEISWGAQHQANERAALLVALLVAGLHLLHMEKGV
jgi:hypothetical protein